MNRTARFIIFLFIISNTVGAQTITKQYNSLLWRVSGNGLSTPSYVYGTMHLTDKRLFNFPDSLYYVLEHSDGFAAEVDMGELMPEIISAINNKKDNDSLIKNLVRADWLMPYRKKLEKIAKKDIGKITVGDVGQLESAMKNQMLRSGEMPAIMDVYLYDIARRQSKWVGGIEDLEDQRKTGTKEDEIMSMVYDITEDKTEVKNKLEWMIKTYLSQRLDSIDLTSQLWKGAEENILIRRNIKMSRRMDSIMQLRTCLFAVGAAHIPGDSGIVMLLRSRGFTVEPVFSPRNIEAGKYQYAAKEIDWVSAGIKNDWYSLQMPGKAEDFKLAENNELIGARLYYDLTRMNAYFTFNFPLDSVKLHNKDSIYNALAENYAKKGKVYSSGNVIVNNVSGKEYTIKSDETDLRLQVFLLRGATVINMMAANKYDSLFGHDAGHFFSSFHLLKDPPVIPDMSWKTYSFPHQAFSIKFPGTYKEHQDLRADSIWKTHYYTFTDAQNDISYWMVAMAANAGYYSDSDSTYFELMKSNILKGFKTGNLISSKQDIFHGFPSYELVLNIIYQKKQLRYKARLINRGSRRYYFYTVSKDDEASKPIADNFLSSFDFLPLESSTWSYRLAPAKDISLWAPAAIIYQPGQDSILSTADYQLYDSLSPATILVNRRYLSPYSWWKSDSAFFREQADLFVGEKYDSLIDYKMIPGAETPQADFTVSSKDNHILKKGRILLNGDTLYSVFSFLPKDLLQTADYTRLFDGIKITRKRTSGYHLVNKTNRILKDMQDGDSASFEKAVSALETASFTKSDLPRLQVALLQPYRDFDQDMYGAHRKLINKILAIDDGSTMPFIKKNYGSLKDSTEKLQYSFLYALLGLKTKESYDLFREIITQKPPVHDNAMMLQYSLTDSLALTASVFPEMLRVSADTSFIKILPVVANRLLDSGLVTTASIEPYKKYFYALAEREIDRLKRETPDYDSKANQLIKFLVHLKEPASYRLLSQFLSIPAISIKKNAAIGLLQNGQPADPLQLEKIAKDMYYRLDFYEELKELKKEKFFPVKYNTQRMLAQSDLCQTASDDYTPDSVIFIAEKTALFMGKQERFYLFKVVYKYDGEETESYLGITGPYSKIPGKIVPRSDSHGVYREEPFDLKKLNTQLKAYLKEEEEYLKEEE